ncbi:MAG: hypothetical protein LBK41_08920 [Clostridiales bacterium]|jgi:hypothetical protein|nr:hypothetical protein [Clostridiales bacterium]
MTNAQRNLIFALAKKCGWGKPELYAHVERLTGQGILHGSSKIHTSLKNTALSYSEASRVINSLLPEELTIPGGFGSAETDAGFLPGEVCVNRSIIVWFKR